MYQVKDIWLPDADGHFREHIEKTGSYMIHRLHAALKFCPRKRVAVDAGAHVGLWSRVFVQQFAFVIAFEPAVDTFECLEKNMAGVANITLHNWALGDWGATPIQMVNHPDTKRADNTGARFAQPGGTIPVIALDSLELPVCDFLKLDVEGMELPTLKGARKTLLRCKPVVMIEIGKSPEERYGIPVKAPLEFLRELGMREVWKEKSDRVLVWI